MTIDPALEKACEHYLHELDRALHGIAVTRKSEILLETGAQLRRMAAQSTGPQDFRARVEADLGSARANANRHRRAAGLPPVSEKPDFRWLRALAIGTLAMLLVFGVAVFLLVRSFLPVFEQDAKTRMIRILGGWVEIDPASGRINMGKGRFRIQPDQMNMSVSRAEGNRIDGVMDLNGVERVVIEAANASIDVRALEAPSSAGRRVVYGCTLGDASAPPRRTDLVAREGTRVRIAIPAGEAGHCEIQVSRGPALEARLGNGNLSLKSLDQDQKAVVDNGNIVFAPLNLDRYEVSAKVRNGTIHLPDQKPAPRELKAELEVGNGTITGP